MLIAALISGFLDGLLAGRIIAECGAPSAVRDFADHDFGDAGDRS